MNTSFLSALALWSGIYPQIDRHCETKGYLLYQTMHQRVHCLGTIAHAFELKEMGGGGGTLITTADHTYIRILRPALLRRIREVNTAVLGRFIRGYSAKCPTF